MKNLLTQWELKRKTDPKLKASFWFSRQSRQVTGSILAVLRRACISYPGLKAVQPCRVLIRGSKKSNHAKSLSGAQGSSTVPSLYPGLKAVQPCRIFIQGSKEFNRAESLSGSQSSPTILSGSQDSSTLSSPYLGLKAVQPC